MALCGIGFGCFQSPNNRTLILSAPRERSGAASGMLGTARLTGQTIGAALVALLLGRLGIDGAKTALLVGAGFAILAAGVSLSRYGKENQAMY
jgi:DHA2 family multidrug resistance protein-like MFS transporter